MSVHRFVAVVVCSCRVSTASWDFFYLFIFSPAIPAIGQRTTSFILTILFYIFVFLCPSFFSLSAYPGSLRIYMSWHDIVLYSAVYLYNVDARGVVL